MTDAEIIYALDERSREYANAHRELQADAFRAAGFQRWYWQPNGQQRPEWHRDVLTVMRVALEDVTLAEGLAREWCVPMPVCEQ